MRNLDLSRYAPLALGAFSGAVAALHLYVAAALMRIDGAGPIAFCVLSGVAFWSSGVAAAALFWVDERDREREEANAPRREALRERLLGRTA